MIYCYSGVALFVESNGLLAAFLKQHGCPTDWNFLLESLAGYQKLIAAVLTKFDLINFADNLIIFLKIAAEMRVFYLNSKMKQELFAE